MTATAVQLPLLPDLPRVLDRRARSGGTAFVGLASRSVLNPPSSTQMGFWSLNPYVGCEFGCAYCYARDTHRWVMERAVARAELSALPLAGSGDAAELVDDLARLPPLEAFERRIFVKTEAAAVLRRTLDPARVGSAAIVIGTATDPYQPAERRFRLTRRILEALLRHEGLTLGLITKSTLVARDRMLLRQLAERHQLKVHISLASAEAELLRKLEPRTPLPHARLRALRSLADAGVPAGVLIAPILPGLTDGWASLAAVLEAARNAGAKFAAGVALRLGTTARTRFLPVLQEAFPELAPRYQRHYARRTHASREYTRALDRRLRLLLEAYGFPERRPLM